MERYNLIKCRYSSNVYRVYKKDEVFKLDCTSYFKPIFGSTKVRVNRNSGGNQIREPWFEMTFEDAIKNGELSTLAGTIDVSIQIACAEEKNFPKGLFSYNHTYKTYGVHFELF